MAKQRIPTELVTAETDDAYAAVLASVPELLKSARHAAARSVNSVTTATYWANGRRIVEEEQAGKIRAVYGARVVERLLTGLTNTLHSVGT